LDDSYQPIFNLSVVGAILRILALVSLEEHRCLIIQIVINACFYCTRIFSFY